MSPSPIVKWRPLRMEEEKKLQAGRVGHWVPSGHSWGSKR